MSKKTKCRYCNGTGVLSCQTPIASIMGGPCGYCTTHYSDCAVYNEPALPKGECDCTWAEDNGQFGVGA